jgi:hypothetical protein
MKIRSGFVSNSSSSSYVIVLPGDPKYDIDNAWDNCGSDSDTPREEFEASLRKDLTRLVKEGRLIELHCFTSIEAVALAIGQYVICTLGVSQGNGEIKVVDTATLKNIMRKL